MPDEPGALPVAFRLVDFPGYQRLKRVGIKDAELDAAGAGI